MAADSSAVGELIAAVAGGKSGAFARLHHLTESRVRAIVLHTVVDQWQAEEVAQEVFLEVWQKAAQFDGSRGNAMTWIRTIATRRAVDRVRAAQASRTRDLRDAARNQVAAHDVVWEAVESRFDRDLLRSSLERITPLQREALTGTYLTGLSFTEAADQLGASERALRTRVRDGIRGLRLVIDGAADAA